MSDLKDMTPLELEVVENIKKEKEDKVQIHEDSHHRLSVMNYDGSFSAMPLEMRVDSKQATFTKEQIEKKLKNYVQVTPKMLFKVSKGIWIRYFDKLGRFRVGGHVISRDEKEHKFVILRSIHHPNLPTRKAYTWSVQVNELRAIFAPERSVLAYKNRRMEEDHRLRTGMGHILRKHFKKKDDDGAYVVYDMVDHKVYVGTAKVLKKKLEGIEDEEDLEKQMNRSLKEQLAIPLGNAYIVTRKRDKNDIVKIRKEKGRVRDWDVVKKEVETKHREDERKRREEAVIKMQKLLRKRRRK